jgi:hypothetical protein
MPQMYVGTWYDVPILDLPVWGLFVVDTCASVASGVYLYLVIDTKGNSEMTAAACERCPSP